MQKSTSAQLDDKVNEKVDQTVQGTVREILAENLNAKAFKKSKKRNSLNTSSTDGVIKSHKAVTENTTSDTTANQPIAPMVQPILPTSNVPDVYRCCWQPISHGTGLYWSSTAFDKHGPNSWTSLFQYWFTRRTFSKRWMRIPWTFQPGLY